MPDKSTCKDCIYFAPDIPEGQIGKCLSCMNEAQQIVLSTSDACEMYSDKDSIDNVGGE